MVAITIPKEFTKKGDLVLIPREEYEALLYYQKIKIRSDAQIYQLKGKKADDLDKLVKNGLKEYRAGKTISAPSLKDALKIYEKKYKKIVRKRKRALGFLDIGTHDIYD